MFILTTLVYPAALAVLCLGSGLLVDRVSGRFLPAVLLATVGAAALIAVSQLTTYLPAIARSTPYLMAVVALAGFALQWPRVRGLARAWRAWRWQLLTVVLAYLLALAPVLLAGRATFSSYMALADSAVHMMGADFLLHHGQHYSHLDLHNSYGQFIHGYYGTSYPSGADTLYGGSALLLGLPLIWAFQPFNAFMLAIAAGPAWLLVRRLGLNGGWAALAALTATVPALVYGYELVGSIKEVTALAMILTLGALVVLHPRWLRGPPRGAIPFALVAAAGVSALGVGFGAWVLAAAVVLAVVLICELVPEPRGTRRAFGLIGVGAIVALIGAWPTWVQLSGSLNVAQNIASTGNPGNLPTPLRALQVFGTWLRGSYKVPPAGGALTITHVLIAVTLLAGLVGAVRVIRLREYPLGGWLALMLVVWLGLSEYSTTWVDAKTLMLTSPVIVILAWGGVAALRASRFRLTAPLLALALAGGVFASDALQYHSSNLAPTARYQELASVNSRFAGRGPTLVTDFDEYSLYELRNLDVGGPDFVFPPPALAGVAGGYGDPVDLDRASPAALLAYPLIVTRRDPAASRPPSAYRLEWQGTYYQVWGRRPGAPAAIAQVALTGAPAVQCSRIRAVAAIARAHGAQLIAAPAVPRVNVDLAGSVHPANWGHQRNGLVLSHPGRLSASFQLPHSGTWELWLQGQIMPAVSISVDGHALASVAGQLDGNSLVPDTITPFSVRLPAGVHRLAIVRHGFTLAPGDDGSAVLDAAFLTPAGAAGRQTLRVTAPTGWRSLCGQQLDWIEAVPSQS
jgi:hypothetical protein